MRGASFLAPIPALLAVLLLACGEEAPGSLDAPGGAAGAGSTASSGPGAGGAVPGEGGGGRASGGGASGPGGGASGPGGGASGPGGGASGPGGGSSGEGGSGGSGSGKPLRVYLDPAGDDARDGLSPGSAVLTLERAHAVVVAEKPGRDVEVRIAPGDYYAQSVTWTFTMPEHTITFMPLAGDKTRPVFHGCPKGSTAGCKHTFFVLDSAKGEATNLHFEYLRVERYRTAISLQGNRNDFSRSNGRSRIFGCYFYEVGNKYNPAGGEAYAVVRLLNSDDNVVRNSHFVKNENTSSAALLHALYVAHGAERNLVEANRFVVHSGDPVRIRDASNGNAVRKNSFIKAGSTAAFSDWYCTGPDCTKAAPECPSWDNEVRDNVLDGDYACEKLSAWHLFKGDTVAGCSKPSASSKRVSTSGNQPTSSPCSGL